MDLTFLRELIAIDSPTGYTQAAADYIYRALKALGYSPQRTNKGAVKCALGPEPTVALAAHMDTLGAMVSGIRDDGTLSLSLLGGLSLTGAEGEYVRIVTHEGQIHTGTLLLNNPSTHANREKEKTQRSVKNMHIRIDEEVYSKADTQKLGIGVGDIICIDPKYVETKSGFIKSRFLDNKAGCFVLYEIARQLRQDQQEVPVELFFSNYEEVGHGGTVGYSSTVKELLVIDMGVLGDDCEGKETKCSICAKDSSGPYDYAFRRTLVNLARENKISHVVDVYPYYSSDGSTALTAGNDFRVGLIGMGVAASHGTERTHRKGIQATIDLALAYIRRK